MTAPADAPATAGDVRLDRPFLLGGWRVEPSTGSLSRDGIANRLEPKVMEVLVELARAGGRVVPRERLIDAVWSDTHVGEAALSRCVSELRRALGDDARDPRFIETLPKRGYRLLAVVATPGDAETATDEPVADTPAGRSRINRWIAGLLVAAIFAAWWLGRPAAGAGDGSIDAVAVLPLRALSESPEAHLLAEGLTGQLVAELASVDGLSVTASSAVRELGADITAREAADLLDVDAVILGSVQASPGRIVVSLELVHGTGGVDVWAGSYQEIGEDPLEVESEVAQQATREIAAALAARAGRPSPRDPASPAVRQAMERGRALGARMRPADALRAVDAYREALRLDDDYAPAWARLADQYASLGWNRWSPPDEAYGQARTAAYEALDRDPRQPDAHAVLGVVAAEFNWDWPEAQRLFETAVRLGPASSFVRDRYSRFLRRLGRLDEALEQSTAALQLQPGSLTAQVDHAWNLLLERRLQEAEATLLGALEMDDDLARAAEGLCAVRALGPDPTAALAPCIRAAGLPGQEGLRGALGYALARAGETTRARQVLDSLRGDYAGTTLGALAEATVLVGLGETETALDALERAVTGREIHAAAVLADPYLRQLRNEPRFGELLRRMLLPGGTDG